MNKQITIPPSVNFHLWEPCNMRCKYCFATFQDVKESLPKGHLPEQDTLDLVKQLAAAGIQKITFAGGEPTLCPWLLSLVKAAHAGGMTTMIVTNGSRITAEWIERYENILDWVALSVDSVKAKTNRRTGRTLGRRNLPAGYYSSIVQLVNQSKIRLKINTVVSAANWQEDLSTFIRMAKPERWKLFQVLPIAGQNDEHIGQFTISAPQFQSFVQRHAPLKESIKIIAESNDLMTSTYAMIGPAGRFFDNSKGSYIYSQPILKVGVQSAFQFVKFSFDKFQKREGMYDWERKSFRA